MRKGFELGKRGYVIAAGGFLLSGEPQQLPAQPAGQQNHADFPLEQISALSRCAASTMLYRSSETRIPVARSVLSRGARRFIFRKSPLPDFYESESTFLLSNHPIASTLSPPTLTSKCRWFPVEAPVVPT